VDCAKGVDRWNKIIEKSGIHFRLKLPHKCFHRKIGTFSQVHVSPEGRMLAEADWTHHRTEWLPSNEDHQFIQSLMKPVHEPGKMANWIAAPARGINNQPAEFEYVRFA
jgi:benzoyl-CoA 2,3-dioxygenase component B